MFEFQFPVYSVYKCIIWRTAKMGKYNRKDCCHFEGIALNMENSFAQKIMYIISVLTKIKFFFHYLVCVK